MILNAIKLFDPIVNVKIVNNMCLNHSHFANQWSYVLYYTELNTYLSIWFRATTSYFINTDMN